MGEPKIIGTVAEFNDQGKYEIRVIWSNEPEDSTEKRFAEILVKKHAKELLRKEKED
jgi:predicted component of type VI protein secretion system